MQAGLVFGHAAVCFTVLTGILTVITYNMEYAVEWFDRIFRSRKMLQMASTGNFALLDIASQSTPVDIGTQQPAVIDRVLPPARVFLPKKPWKPRATPLRDLEQSF